MRRFVLAPVALLLLALPLITGCGNKVTAPSGTGQQTADDLAIQAVTSMTLVGGDVQLSIASTPPSAPMSARRAAPARALWDTTVVMNGITYEASRTFYDASDNALPGWDPLAVRLRWTSRAYGTYQGPRDTASVGHDALLDVRGIQSGEDTLTFDGQCRDTLQNTFRSLDGTRMRYFLWVSSTAVNAVKFLKSTLGTGAWPLSGTVTYIVSADRLRTNNRTDVEAHFDATVVVIFDGTPFPEIVVNGTYHYRWNMLTGTVSRA
jgi:hypothetical protein